MMEIYRIALLIRFEGWHRDQIPSPQRANAMAVHSNDDVLRHDTARMNQINIATLKISSHLSRHPSQEECSESIHTGEEWAVREMLMHQSTQHHMAFVITRVLSRLRGKAQNGGKE